MFKTEKKCHKFTFKLLLLSSRSFKNLLPLLLFFYSATKHINKLLNIIKQNSKSLLNLHLQKINTPGEKIYLTQSQL